MEYLTNPSVRNALEKKLNMRRLAQLSTCSTGIRNAYTNELKRYLRLYYKQYSIKIKDILNNIMSYQVAMDYQSSDLYRNKYNFAKKEKNYAIRNLLKFKKIKLPIFSKLPPEYGNLFNAIFSNNTKKIENLSRSWFNKIRKNTVLGYRENNVNISKNNVQLIINKRNGRFFLGKKRFNINF